MDPALKEFAAKIWQKQKSINRYQDVYDVYNAIRPGTATLDLEKKKQYLGYLKRLQVIALQRETTAGHKDPKVQCAHDYVLNEGVGFLEDHLLRGGLDLGRFQSSNLVGGLVRNRWKKGGKDKYTAEDLEKAMFKTFFHFFAKQGGDEHRETLWRIYLNVKAAHAIEFMQDVVNRVVDNMDVDPEIAVKMTGVKEAKVAGPWALDSGRSDGIVIYLNAAPNSNPLASMLNVLEDKIKPLLRERGNQSKLNDVGPEMTQRIWPGVYVGAEPSREQVDKGHELRGGEDEGPDEKYSFGSLRCQAIYKALKEYKSLPVAQQNDRDALLAFFGKVEEQFRQHHINPDLPFT